MKITTPEGYVLEDVPAEMVEKLLNKPKPKVLEQEKTSLDIEHKICKFCGSKFFRKLTHNDRSWSMKLTCDSNCRFKLNYNKNKMPVKIIKRRGRSSRNYKKMAKESLKYLTENQVKLNGKQLSEKMGYNISGGTAFKFRKQLLKSRKLTVYKGKIQTKDLFNKEREEREFKEVEKINKKRKKEFMVDRINYLTKYCKLSYEQAKYKAGRELSGEDKQLQKAPLLKDNFPEFVEVKEEYLHILESIVKNMIANTSNITYLNEGYMIGIEDGSTWKNFVVGFLAKSNDISNYFSVPNKFHHISVGKGFKFDALRYGDKYQ